MVPRKKISSNWWNIFVKKRGEKYSSERGVGMGMSAAKGGEKKSHQKVEMTNRLYASTFGKMSNSGSYPNYTQMVSHYTETPLRNYSIVIRRVRRPSIGFSLHWNPLTSLQHCSQESKETLNWMSLILKPPTSLQYCTAESKEALCRSPITLKPPYITTVLYWGE